MTAKIFEFLEHVKSRPAALGGFGTASEYVNGLVQTCGGVSAFGKYFNGLSQEAISKAIKDSANTLVYKGTDSIVTGCKTPASLSGSPMKELGSTPKSIMDFEAIFTTDKRDRDKDILHPEGAEVDMNMPLLWQHCSWEPIGKLVQIVNQDSKEVRGHCAIADTPLGRDAAVLAEFGALRISHGFMPTKFEQIREGDNITGYKVLNYQMYEVSLVSIPSNTDAIITAISRQKLFSPLIKNWADTIASSRPAMVRSGYDGSGSINVTVNLNAESLAASVTDAVTKTLSPGKKEDAPAGSPPASDAPSDGTQAPPATPPEVNPTEAALEVPEKTPLLSDISASIDKLAGMGDLPAEAQARISVVQGIISSLSTELNDHAEAVSESASEADLAAAASAHEEMVNRAIARLQNAYEELGRVADIDGIDPAAIDAINSSREMIDQLLSALRMIADATGDEEEIASESDSASSEDGSVDSSTDAAGDVEPLPSQNSHDVQAKAHSLLCDLAGGAEISLDLKAALVSVLT